MTLNIQQSKIVDCLDGSVNVVAGAGTGKTYTLTQRIVEIVKRALDQNPEDDDPTGHVLAITFTKKAAGELKSRVRQAFLELASDGEAMAQRYLECAMTIDSSWISTMHSMASRILRENAIDFGIDPCFTVLTKQEADGILSEALQLALDDVVASGDAELADLVGERDIEGGLRMFKTVSDDVEKLLSVASYLPDGLDAVDVFESRFSPEEAVSDFLNQAKLVRRLLDLDGWNGVNSVPQLSEDLDAALSKMDAWMESYEQDGDISIDGLFEALYAFPRTTNKLGSKSEHFDDMLRYRLEYKLASDRLALLIPSKRAASLLRFTRMVKGRMDELKSMGGTKFAERDLLAVCNAKLSDPENLTVLESYRERFHYIMLDEFQDTDPLQMSLISKLARYPREGGELSPSNLCTVGDMQQSIYRFRGGDVEETLKRIDSLKDGRGHQFELSGNYRSHRDVLDAVECVFSQPDAFGEGFLHLDASRDVPDDPALDGVPRVEVSFMHGNRGQGRGASESDKVLSDDVRLAAAIQITEHFRLLKERGARPSQMAILLGKMTNAGTYAKALRDAGFECAITGGSVFADSHEAKLVETLLAFAVSQDDDMALLNVLTSDLFQVSDDALLGLVRGNRADETKPKRLGRAFASFEGLPILSESDNASLSYAKRAIGAFVHEAMAGSAALALRRVFADSGRLAALQESGGSENLADAGNISKAIRIVSEIERSSCGIAEVHSRYAAHIGSCKEAPGILAATDSEYVQIMTVHASKGLEFDHVALAEMKEGVQSNSHDPLILESIDGRAYLTIGASKESFPDPSQHEGHSKLCSFDFEGIGLDRFGRSLDELHAHEGEEKQAASERRKRGIAEAASYELRHALIAEHSRIQDLEEARRLMYVAMTRARETLFVSICSSLSISSGYKGVYADIYNALAKRFDAPDGDFDDEFMVSDGSIMARRKRLASQDELKEYLEGFVHAGHAILDDDRLEGLPAEYDSLTGVPSIRVPVYPSCIDETVGMIRHDWSREGIHSYTSLSKHADGMNAVEDKPDGVKAAEPEPTAFINGDASMESASLDASTSDMGDATSLGTAFHRLCQMSIIEAASDGSHSLRMPPESRILAQSRAIHLTDSQLARLIDALRLWFGCQLAKGFASHDRIAAEVPFSVLVSDGEGCSFVLEGEMDGLADDCDGNALLIDYKTGKMDGTTLEELKERHLLQSKCYAYALLTGGYSSVTACFVKVEEPDSAKDFDDTVGRPATVQPITVEYSYSLDDVSSLRDDLIGAYRYSILEG